MQVRVTASQEMAIKIISKPPLATKKVQYVPRITLTQNPYAAACKRASVETRRSSSIVHRPTRTG